jgi:hypothetical protein
MYRTAQRPPLPPRRDTRAARCSELELVTEHLATGRHSPSEVASKPVLGHSECHRQWWAALTLPSCKPAGGSSSPCLVPLALV